MTIGFLGRWTALACMAVACLSVVGCGGGQGVPYDTVPVSGKITYKDGSKIDAYRIKIAFLVPENLPGKIDPNRAPRSGLTEVTTGDGVFSEVTTWRPGDGVMPGKHKVTVVSLDRNEMPTAHVPAKYAAAETTDLEVEVTPGMGPIELKIDK